MAHRPDVVLKFDLMQARGYIRPAIEISRKLPKLRAFVPSCLRAFVPSW